MQKSLTPDQSLIQQIHGQIRSLSPEARMSMLSQLEKRVCLNCGAMKFTNDRENGEVVCMNCGLVQNDGGEVKFAETYEQGVQCSPTSNLSYGHSLGDTLPKQETFRVLAKMAPLTNKDLDEETNEALKVFLKKNVGLRARFIRIFNSSVEPNCVKKALSLGTELCSQFGITGDDAFKFRDEYGKLLRKAAAIAMVMKRPFETFEARKLSVAAFVYMWQQLEMQYGMRKTIHYQQSFPSFNARFRRGLKNVKLNSYKVRKEAWDFVIFASKITLPATVLEKKRKVGML